MTTTGNWYEGTVGAVLAPPFIRSVTLEKGGS